MYIELLKSRNPGLAYIRHAIRVLRYGLALLLLSGCNNVQSHVSDRLSADPAIELGRYLFYDNQLSFNQTKSCGSCHDPAMAFTDGYRKSATATGDNVMHNASSLLNVVYQKRLDWANPLVTNTFQQNERPLYNQHPIEMGATNNEEHMLQYFRSNRLYSRLFAAAYPGDAGITMMHIRTSLSAFVNSLISANSPYDAYLAGDSTRLSASAKHGMKLFFSPEFQCSSCHTPPLFSINDARNNISPDSIYFNIGLYNLGETGDYPGNDQGLFLFTHKSGDKGKFKVPSLRNIAFTAPYMHDGAVASLGEVIDIYKRGGRLTIAGADKGDGSLNPNKDSRLKGFPLTLKEKKDIIEFLYSLTDSTVTNNPAFLHPGTE